MKKSQILFLILLCFCLIPSINAYTHIEYSLNNATWVNYTDTDDNATTIEVLNDGLNSSTNYFFRLKHFYNHTGSGWVYINATTKTAVSSGGLDDMQLTEIIGIMGVIFILLYFAFNLDSEHKFLKIILACVSLYLVILIPSNLLNGEATTNDNLYRAVAWILRIFFIYIFLYFNYKTWIKKILQKWGYAKE